MASEIEQGSDGLYALCVFFAENTSDEEMHEIFGKFGPIFNIHRVKNITFVRFQHLNDAVNCYEAMQSDSRFKVKPGRKQKKWSTENGNQRGNDMNRRPNEGMDFRGGSRNNGNDFNNRHEGEPNSYNKTNETRRDNPLPPMPKLVPKLSASAVDQGAEGAPKKAKEVIVANLPQNMKQCNIYELCTKANGPPLHVEMKSATRPHEAILYYAHVFVKDDKDAKNIVQGLNNLTVNGFQLIVASVETLKEEAKEIAMSQRR